MRSASLPSAVARGIVSFFHRCSRGRTVKSTAAPSAAESASPLGCPLLPPRGLYPQHRHPLTIDEAARVRLEHDGGDELHGAQPLVPHLWWRVEEMGDGMRDGMWDVGRVVDMGARSLGWRARLCPL